jgi:hypothetical protein
MIFYPNSHSVSTSFVLLLQLMNPLVGGSIALKTCMLIKGPVSQDHTMLNGLKLNQTLVYRNALPEVQHFEFPTPCYAISLHV